MAQARRIEDVVEELKHQIGTLEAANRQQGQQLQRVEGDLQTRAQEVYTLQQGITHERTRRLQLGTNLDAANQQIQLLMNAPNPPAGPHPQPRGASNKVKVNHFSNATEEDWLVWKHHFNQCRQLNGYTVDESKLALAAAMKGRAAAAVMDLRVLDPQQTVADLIQAYENRFLPASASQLSRVQFEQVSQGPKETILDFHARLRQLWNKAYPNLQDETMLIRKFSLGLRRSDVRRQVIRTNPNTYGDALEAAQNEASVAQVCSVTETGAAAAEPMEIGAMIKGRINTRKKIANMDRRRPAAPGGSTGKKGGACHFCGKPGHWKNECNLLNKAKKHMSSRGRGSSAPKGNTTWRKNFRQSKPAGSFGRYGNGRMIALIEELVPEAELDEMSVTDLQDLAAELSELAPELNEEVSGGDDEEESSAGCFEPEEENEDNEDF